MIRRRRLASIATVLVAAAAALAGCGGSGASTAPATGSPGASGVTSPASELVTDVDIGGRTLHLVCVGPTDTGEPTILLESGGGSPYSAWSEVLVAMQATHRLCAYDRAGLGASQPAPEASRTTTDLVDDLRALLDGASISGPLVLGSWSIGAWPSTLFTQRYPDEVVGLVFVDPRGPRVSEAFRALIPPPEPNEPAMLTREREDLETFEIDPSLNEEHLHLQESAAEVAAVLDEPGPLFGDRPVVVLTAANLLTMWQDLSPELESEFRNAWIAGQQELADESRAGTRTVVSNSGHGIQIEQPTAVISALETVLAEVASPS